MNDALTAGDVNALRDKVRSLASELASTAKDLGEASAKYELGIALDSVAMKPKETAPAAPVSAEATGSDSAKDRALSPRT